MKLANLAKRSLFNLGEKIRYTGQYMENYAGLQKQAPYSEKYSKHRNIYNMYDLKPAHLQNTFIAPNATIVGEVIISSECTIWYGTVLRGDINGIMIGNCCSIGDNCVLTTCSSLPNGLTAMLTMGNDVFIQSQCTLYSCELGDNCMIGFKSVILEGARIGTGSIIGPNSVVPPGRDIPANQVWAGNPVEYIRDIGKQEVSVINHMVKQQTELGTTHQYEFSPYNTAYLQKENDESTYPQGDEWVHQKELDEDRSNFRANIL